MAKTGYDTLVENEPLFGVPGTRDLLNVLATEGRVKPDDAPSSLMQAIVNAGLEGRGFVLDRDTGEYFRPSLRPGTSRVRKEIFESILRGNSTCIQIVRDTGRTKATVLRNVHHLIVSGDVAKQGEHNHTRYIAVSNG